MLWVILQSDENCLFVFFFFFSSGSCDGNNQLIIKGRFQQKQIETVLRRYISKQYIIYLLFSAFDHTFHKLPNIKYHALFLQHNV